MAETIGFVGAGQMGEPMVVRLLDAGHEVNLYARRPEVRERLGARGVALVDSPAELARRSDIVIACLFSDEQLLDVAGGPDGILANAEPGAVVVSHTTGNIGTVTGLAAQHPDGPVLLDGPISGSAEDIAAGRLTVLLGGHTAAAERAQKVLEAYSSNVIHTGGLGTALSLKLVNNLLFAGNAQLVAAALDLGARLGVEDAAFLDALTVCSGRSHASSSVRLLGSLEKFGKVAGPFLRKDVAACVDAADDAGVELGWLRTVVADGPLSLS
ncbi:NAD(P)-dependent oxidoreductase [Rhodococcus sp. NPDC004095]